MEEVKIFRLRDIESHPLAAIHSKEGGFIKRIIYPLNVNTKGLIFGFAEVNPGYSPHRWDAHIADKAPGFEVTYPKDFEEVYYIISGSGVVQWKTEDGEIKEEKVSAGDTKFFPIGVSEHQLFNNSTENIIMVYCGSPLLSPKINICSKDTL